MALTDEELVGGIIELDEDIDLEPFMDAAHYFIEKVVTHESYTVADKTMIETWLAAHLYAVRDPRSFKEYAGDVGVTYQSKVDLGFDVTQYGQQAMRMDIHGGLARLNKQAMDPATVQRIQVLYIGNSRLIDDPSE